MAERLVIHDSSGREENEELPGAFSFHRRPSERFSADRNYAGFWVRAAATLIDLVILAVLRVVGFFVAVAVGDDFGLVVLAGWLLIVPWLYFAGSESSSWQATLGKKAFRLAVIDASGARIGFGRATVRVMSKLVSMATFGIGFVVAGFTPQKQGLHDFIARTAVVRNEA